MQLLLCTPSCHGCRTSWVGLVCPHCTFWPFPPIIAGPPGDREWPAGPRAAAAQDHAEARQPHAPQNVSAARQPAQMTPVRAAVRPIPAKSCTHALPSRATAFCARPSFFPRFSSSSGRCSRVSGDCAGALANNEQLPGVYHAISCTDNSFSCFCGLTGWKLTLAGSPVPTHLWFPSSNGQRLSTADACSQPPQPQPKPKPPLLRLQKRHTLPQDLT